MKQDKIGSLSWRKISPFGVLPKALVPSFLRGEKEAISKASEWIEKYGLIILFTQGKAKGWEEVWVSEEGVIYMNDPDYEPTDFEIEIRLRKVDAPEAIFSETKKKKLEYLKKYEKAL